MSQQFGDLTVCVSEIPLQVNQSSLTVMRFFGSWARSLGMRSLSPFLCAHGGKYHVTSLLRRVSMSKDESLASVHGCLTPMSSSNMMPRDQMSLILESYGVCCSGQPPHHIPSGLESTYRGELVQLAFGLLRARVPRCTAVQVGERAPGAPLGEAKVGNHGRTLCVKQNVAGLEVFVGHADRVELVKGDGDASEDERKLVAFSRDVEPYTMHVALAQREEQEPETSDWKRVRQTAGALT